MQDTVCDIPIPPEDSADWRENMRIYVKSTMQVFRDHPWYGDIPIMGIPITPNNLRFIDWGLRFMKDMPLNDYERMSLILLLSNYSRSSGMMRRDLDRAVQAGSTRNNLADSIIRRTETARNAGSVSIPASGCDVGGLYGGEPGRESDWQRH